MSLARRAPLGNPRSCSEIRAPRAVQPGAAPVTTGVSGPSPRHAPCSPSGVMTRSPATFALAAAALLALAGPGRVAAGPAEDRAAAQAELAELAPRIERLKRDAAAGLGRSAELPGLLARAQALAALLERTGSSAPVARAAAPGPDAQELRERADALRDRADKEAAGLVAVERRLAELSRRAELSERLEALGIASELFAEAATGRGAAGATSATDGPTTATPGAEPTGGLAGSTAPGLRAAAEPGGVGVAPLGDDPATLRRRRAELGRTISALRAQAEALDAEARAAEGR